MKYVEVEQVEHSWNFLDFGANVLRDSLWLLWKCLQGLLTVKHAHYFDIYHRHLQHFRGKKMHLLEIGVASGGSLQMWKARLWDFCVLQLLQACYVAKPHEQTQSFYVCCNGNNFLFSTEASESTIIVYKLSLPY